MSINYKNMYMKEPNVETINMSGNKPSKLDYLQWHDDAERRAKSWTKAEAMP